MIFLVPVAIFALAYLFSEASSGTNFLDEVTDMSNRLYNLKDIDPASQGGSYNTNYDIYFEAYADKTGVPFALLKAHAIQESSLNPNAYLNENPTARADRQGWASRGLLQILWWPGSQRFAAYGYPDKDLGVDGVRMFEPEINVDISSQIMKANLKSAKGNIRDAINMYNTGKIESQFPAPGEYVNKVLKYYNKILGA